VGIANWSQIAQVCWSMRKGCNRVLLSDSGWSCLLFVYVLWSNYLLLVNFWMFFLEKTYCHAQDWKPFDRCMRDELKFPKVSSGLLCGMEEDHFCWYESPQIQAAIYIITILWILKEWLLELKRISVLLQFTVLLRMQVRECLKLKVHLKFSQFLFEIILMLKCSKRF
jgi:hypothetical protein